MLVVWEHAITIQQHWHNDHALSGKPCPVAVYDAVPDIARELDLSVSMVEKHIRRGRHMIEQETRIPKAGATVPMDRC